MDGTKELRNRLGHIGECECRQTPRGPYPWYHRHGGNNQGAVHNQNTVPRERWVSIALSPGQDSVNRLEQRAPLTSQGCGRPNGRLNPKRYASGHRA